MSMQRDDLSRTYGAIFFFCVRFGTLRRPRFFCLLLNLAWNAVSMGDLIRRELPERDRPRGRLRGRREPHSDRLRRTRRGIRRHVHAAVRLWVSCQLASTYSFICLYEYVC